MASGWWKWNGICHCFKHKTEVEIELELKFWLLTGRMAAEISETTSIMNIRSQRLIFDSLGVCVMCLPCMMLSLISINQLVVWTERGSKRHHQLKMAALVCRTFWLHVWIMGAFHIRILMVGKYFVRWHVRMSSRKWWVYGLIRLVNCKMLCIAHRLDFTVLEGYLGGKILSLRILRYIILFTWLYFFSMC